MDYCGVLAAGAGLTAVAVHGYRSHYGGHAWHYGDDGYHGKGRRGWKRWFGRGPVSKEDCDARTRSRFARFDATNASTIDSEEVRALIERAWSVVKDGCVLVGPAIG